MPEKYFIACTSVYGFDVRIEQISWVWNTIPGSRTLTEAIKHAQRRGYDTIVTVVM